MKKLQKFDVWPGPDYKPIKTIDDKYNFVRVSRWIKVKTNYNPGRNNSLWDYVTDEKGYRPYNDSFNPENGLYLDYFRFDGRTYAVNQFIGIGSIADCIGHHTGYIENGQECYLSGYDENNLYSPIYVEFDPCCEYVRIYEEV